MEVGTVRKSQVFPCATQARGKMWLGLDEKHERIWTTAFASWFTCLLGVAASRALTLSHLYTYKARGSNVRVSVCLPVCVGGFVSECVCLSICLSVCLSADDFQLPRSRRTDGLTHTALYSFSYPLGAFKRWFPLKRVPTFLTCSFLVPVERATGLPNLGRKLFCNQQCNIILSLLQVMLIFEKKNVGLQ